ncbi:MAG TPA: aspartate carbamoyltransferase [Terriglobales bacterium]|nr:aspartate carbamoyltransferase [Terriglobales bacterium]
MRNLIDFDQMTLEEWYRLYDLAKDIMGDPAKYMKSCEDKLVATLFYEPSTRTQFSFQAAALRLGAKVIGFSGTAGSSVTKGENLKDTVRTVASYSDLIVMRNPSEGAACAASLYARVPIVNAGDGGHLHPTQTLTDLTTLTALKGGVSGHTVGFCGDLKNGRTVHSLIKALVRFPGNAFVLISTSGLRIPDYVRKVLEASGAPHREENSLEAAIGELDVLYMTRIQKERFESEEAYKKEAGVYILDAKKLALAKADLVVLHPLPKVDEITDEADEDPRCHYFDQTEFGMYIRMALLHTLLKEGKEARQPAWPRPNTDKICGNPRCITRTESYLPKLGEGGRCLYCDHALI